MINYLVIYLATVGFSTVVAGILALCGVIDISIVYGPRQRGGDDEDIPADTSDI